MVEQPRYLTVSRALAREIGRGAARSGDRLPSERTLCRQFGVSRVTVRRALADLRQQGLIEAAGPKGWFVAASPLGEPSALMSFSEMAAVRGLTASSRVLGANTRPASLDEAEAFAIAPGAPVFDLERIRLLSGLPVGLEQSRIPLHVAPILAEAHFSHTSLYETLRSSGVEPTRSDYVLQAVPADERQAASLGLEIGAPLLMASATTFDQVDRVIELSRSLFRGDRYRFQATLLRGRGISVGLATAR